MYPATSHKYIVNFYLDIINANESIKADHCLLLGHAIKQEEALAHRSIKRSRKMGSHSML